MIELPFVDRPPTAGEVERIRLILSTYQDGTGMLALKEGGTLPGWRDFERAVAVALGGVAQESKAVFDVVLHSPADVSRPNYGISCKMRRELNRVARDGRATIELTNAAGEFWDALEASGIDRVNYASKATQAGTGLANVVEGWHRSVDNAHGGKFDLQRSSYLVLLWNKQLDYQLFSFPLRQFDPTKLKWSVPQAKGSAAKEGRRLCGFDGTGNLVEWYGSSGGQLKLYPLVATATWRSARFRLEPLPRGIRPVETKAESYFPRLWRAAV